MGHSENFVISSLVRHLLDNERSRYTRTQHALQRPPVFSSNAPSLAEMSLPPSAPAAPLEADTPASAEEDVTFAPLRVWVLPAAGGPPPPPTPCVARCVWHTGGAAAPPCFDLTLTDGCRVWSKAGLKRPEAYSLLSDSAWLAEARHALGEAVPRFSLRLHDRKAGGARLEWCWRTTHAGLVGWVASRPLPPPTFEEAATGAGDAVASAAAPGLVLLSPAASELGSPTIPNAPQLPDGSASAACFRLCLEAAAACVKKDRAGAVDRATCREALAQEARAAAAAAEAASAKANQEAGLYAKARAALLSGYPWVLKCFCLLLLFRHTPLFPKQFALLLNEKKARLAEVAAARDAAEGEAAALRQKLEDALEAATSGGARADALHDALHEGLGTQSPERRSGSDSGGGGEGGGSDGEAEVVGWQRGGGGGGGGAASSRGGAASPMVVCTQPATAGAGGGSRGVKREAVSSFGGGSGGGGAGGGGASSGAPKPPAARAASASVGRGGVPKKEAPKKARAKNVPFFLNHRDRLF